MNTQNLTQDTINIKPSKKNFVYRLFYFIASYLLYNHALFFGFNYSEEKIYQDITLAIIAKILLIFSSISLFTFLLDALCNRYYKKFLRKKIPLKNYCQILKSLLKFGSIIFALSLLINKSPVYFLTALGAFAAILLLIFKETLLGFLASIQLIIYDMVRIGDWIEVPSYSADGEVIDISFNTLQIRNIDYAVVTIPSYAALNLGLKNWRGLQEANGHRVKRSLNIDVDTIKVCQEDLIQKLLQSNKIQPEDIANKNEITNLELFRLYIEKYLWQHAQIHKNKRLLIRELQGTSAGLPVEIYFFTNQIDIKQHELVQAEIFDYVYAMLHFFELRVFRMG